MSWHSYRPYVPVAQRRRQAEAAAKKMGKKGRTLAPVRLNGRAIANTFWGKAWCTNLESYSDFENRLPRGRTYVRNGSVIDLQISAGKVDALVQGSSLYKIAIQISPLPPKRWQEFKSRCAGKVANLLDLLQGRLSPDILTDLTAHGTGLFPTPKEIKLGCSCPDWADMCKHVAAVLYGVGARLDTQPELFFTLRGVDHQELIAAAGAAAAEPIAAGTGPEAALAGQDLGAIFGVEIESTAPAEPAAAPAKATPAKRTTKRPAPRRKLAPSRKLTPSRREKPAARTARSRRTNRTLGWRRGGEKETG